MEQGKRLDQINFSTKMTTLGIIGCILTMLLLNLMI